MGVSTGLIWILALMPQLVTAQAYISSQPYTALGHAGSTMYVTPEGAVGNSRQIVGYQLVSADNPYHQQYDLEQSLVDSYGRLSDILSQQTFPRQSYVVRPGYDINRRNIGPQTTVLHTNKERRQHRAEVLPTQRQANHANGQFKAGYGKKKSSGYRKKQVKVVKKPVYVPVPLKQQKKKKKKSKTLSVSKGFYIAGGSQMFGKFKTLKSCQKACDKTAHCFGGDYDKWTKRCYMHTNSTACNSLQPHKQLTNFRKVPCAANDFGINYGRITLGANLDHGLLQKKVKDIGTCIKKCLQAGGGVAGTITATVAPPIPIPAAVTEVLGTPQLCFGIDYDFATHKCYFHTSVTLLNDDTVGAAVLLRGIPGGITCVAESDDTVPRQPINLLPDSSVVNIVICPRPTVPVG